MKKNGTLCKKTIDTQDGIFTTKIAELFREAHRQRFAQLKLLFFFDQYISDKVVSFYLNSISVLTYFSVSLACKHQNKLELYKIAPRGAILYSALHLALLPLFSLGSVIKVAHNKKIIYHKAMQ